MLLGGAESRSIGEPPRVGAQVDFLTSMCTQEDPPLRRECEKAIRFNLDKIAMIETLANDPGTPEVAVIEAFRKAEEEHQHLDQYMREQDIFMGAVISDIVAMLLDATIARANKEPVPAEVQCDLLCGFLGVQDNDSF